MVLELAAEPREFGVVEREDAVVADEHDAMWVAHRDCGDLLDAPRDFEGVVDNAAVVVGRNFATLEDWLAHIDRCRDRAAAIEFERDRFHAAVGIYGDWILAPARNFVIEPSDTADAVAAHLAAAAVRVVHLHPDVRGLDARVGALGRAQHDQSVAADSETTVGEPL